MKRSQPPECGAYYLLETEDRSVSRSGLETQRKAVREYLNAGRLTHEFLERDPGRGKAPPKLRQAIRWCKANEATLVIGNLGFLVERDIELLSMLVDSNVDFVAADMPTANKLLSYYLKVFAEQRKKVASARISAGLAAAKDRGVRLGKYARTLSRRNRDAALARAKDLQPTINSLRSEGITTVRAIAHALNERGLPTPKGGRWHPTSVERLLKRLEVRGRV